MKRALIALTAALVVVLAPLPAAASGPDDITVTVPGSEDTTRITNAELRWGMNAETGAGAFAGGCNFLSAGVAGNTGSSRAWTAADGFFQAQSGNVRIVKPTARGEWEAASWENKCLDATGKAVTTADKRVTGIQVGIVGGTGTIAKDGSIEIGWEGSFTVAFYGGMTYWTVTNPVLTLDGNGNGKLIATASGYGASRDDASVWQSLPKQTIVLATIHGADVASSGFAVVPDYLGVAVSGADQVPKTAENAAYWGSFPDSFVGYQRLTGQAGYWLTTGGAKDAAKPATTLYINYDAAAPVITPPVTTPPDGGSAVTPKNPVVQRPAAAAKPSAKQAATAAGDDIVAGITPITLVPAVASLIPLASTGMPLLNFIVLLAVFAFLVAGLCALAIARRLPWQRRANDV